MVTRARVVGFTLVELLIAMTVLTMVIGLSSFAFSLFSRYWDGNLERFERSLGSLQRLDLVITALDDALPWAVRGGGGEVGFYFLGREEGVTFVTNSPVFEPGAPALVRLFREQTKNGKWALYYEEAPLGEVSLRFASQVVPFKYRLQVLGSASEIGFRYYGYESRGGAAEAELGAEPEVAIPIWLPEYDGMVRYRNPLKVALAIDRHESVFDMPERDNLILSALDEGV
jgi:prepilin-type N-terminal cleavage/methylation domain-containing protein